MLIGLQTLTTSESKLGCFKFVTNYLITEIIQLYPEYLAWFSSLEIHSEYQKLETILGTSNLWSISPTFYMVIWHLRQYSFAKEVQT
jgi:hypothetical protein